MSGAELELAPASPLAELAHAREILKRERDLSKVKAILDVAVAAKEYARAKKLGAEAEKYAAEIAIRAERRYGELLAGTPKATPGPKPAEKIGTDGVPNSTPRQKAGKKLSARSQKLARVDEQTTEDYLTKAKRPTVSGLLRRHREVAPAPVAVPEVITPELTIRHCACAELASHIEPDSVDLVFTDPPYGREHIPRWDDLGALAAKVLKPGGLVVAYSGQMFLPEAMAGMAAHLDYWWMYAIVHDGAFFQLRNRRTQVGWKPLLVYRKPGADLTLLPWVKDIVSNGGREKTSDEWQQADAEAAYWIETLTAAGAHVADPFLGGGTTAAVCKRLGRQFTGCDIDAVRVAASRERVA